MSALVVAEGITVSNVGEMFDLSAPDLSDNDGRPTWKELSVSRLSLRQRKTLQIEGVLLEKCRRLVSA